MFRLVLALMGATAMAQRKMEFGPAVIILGIRVTPKRLCVKLELDEAKRKAYLELVCRALHNNCLTMGGASKLAGKLSFMSCWCFKRLGRAMLRPLFQHSHVPSRNNKLRNNLELALAWWGQVLQTKIVEQVSFSGGDQWYDLFCDARSSPPRLAAVLVDKQGCCSFTDWQPDASLLGIYAQESAGDKNILILELLAIILSLSTFSHVLSTNNVKIWTDNVGGEGALRKGASRKGTANMAIHNVWTFAARQQIGIWVDRVPTKQNIADGPSREDYSTLVDVMGADWVEPKFSEEFYSINVRQQLADVICVD